MSDWEVMLPFGLLRNFWEPGKKAPGDRPEPTQTTGGLDALLIGAEQSESKGRTGDAIAALREAIRLHPDDPRPSLALGSVYYSGCRFRDAYKVLQGAYENFPADVNVNARLGWAAYSCGVADEAVARMRTVAELRPLEPEAHFGLGVALQAVKHFEDARASFERVIALDASAVHSYINLGVCHLEGKRFADAEGAFRRALTLSPRNPGAWLNLGVALHRQSDGRALQAYETCRLLEIETGDHVDCFVSYASYLRNVGRIDLAIQLYRENLPAHPSTSGLTQFGMCMLHLGQFYDGWNLYEFRWLQEPLISLRVNIDKPIWQGQDLTGKTILVRAEQGVGDVIQFVRYLPKLKDLGATVVYQGRDGMEDMTSLFEGIDFVAEPGKVIPDFSYYTNLMSLPRFLGTPKPGASEVSYIRVAPSAISVFSRLLDPTRLNVGLVWAGNPTHLLDSIRSMPLSIADALTRVDNVSLYSLQKGDAATQLYADSFRSRIADWGPKLATYTDTAAAIGSLDLIISVDTSVAHLAGALGKPTWILLPEPAEWRWMDRVETTAWYPNSRLIRQQSSGDWASVVREVKESLAKLAATKLSALTDTESRRDFTVRAPKVTTEYAPMMSPRGLTAMGEMSEGIFQYFPERGDEGIALRWYGEWHHAQLALLARLVRVGQTVLEIGAGIGIHTVAVSRLIGRGGHIMAYESDRTVRRVLQQNLAANKVQNATLMLNTPLGVEAGQPAEDAESIDDLALEDICWLKVSGPTNLHSVLRGAANTIWAYRPKMLLNVGENSNALIETLATFGYSCWVHKSQIYRSVNFNKSPNVTPAIQDQAAILAVPDEIDLDVNLDDCAPVTRHD